MSAPQYPSHVPCPECGEYKKPIGANMCWDCKDKEMADLRRPSKSAANRHSRDRSRAEAGSRRDPDANER